MSKLMLVAVLFVSFACKKKEDTGAAAPAAKPATPAPAGSAAPSGEPAAAPMPAAPAAPAVSGEPVDCCAMMPKDKVEAAVGKLAMDLSSEPAKGSLLGMCMGGTDKGLAVSVSARPASEFDATVKYSKGKDLAGVGEKASFSEDVGMLVKVPGKPYFLQVTAADTKTMKQDEAAATALAKIAIENAK